MKNRTAEREREIRELMEQTGMAEEDAAFALAIEHGEIPGDVIEIEDGKEFEGGGAIPTKTAQLQ